MNRPQAKKNEIDYAIELVRFKLNTRLAEKGWGKYAGPHETYGILAEEFKELMDDLHVNNVQQFGDELIDIAVAAIFGLVSLMPEDY